MHLSTRVTVVSSFGAVEADSPQAGFLVGCSSVHKAKIVSVAVAEVEIGLTTGGFDVDERLATSTVLFNNAPLLAASHVVGQTNLTIAMGKSEMSFTRVAIDPEVSGTITAWLDSPDFALSSKSVSQEGIAVGVTGRSAEELWIVGAMVQDNDVVKKSLSHITLDLFVVNYDFIACLLTSISVFETIPVNLDVLVFHLSAIGNAFLVRAAFSGHAALQIYLSPTIRNRLVKIHRMELKTSYISGTFNVSVIPFITTSSSSTHLFSIMSTIQSKISVVVGSPTPTVDGLFAFQKRVTNSSVFFGSRFQNTPELVINRFIVSLISGICRNIVHP